MEHRKRSRMQHKVELSTLLRIAIASKKSIQFRTDKHQNVTKALAFEAMESVKKYDHCTVSEEQYKSIFSIL